MCKIDSNLDYSNFTNAELYAMMRFADGRWMRAKSPERITFWESVTKSIEAEIAKRK